MIDTLNKKYVLERWISNSDTLPYCGTSAGGGYSTVNDLLRFATALTGHKLLDETAYYRAHQSHVMAA